jgi:subtilisin family serine protease
VHRCLLFIFVLALAPSAAAASHDPSFPSQWALRTIGAEEAWTVSTGALVRIGIVDSGVDLAHEDLAGKVVAHANCLGSAGDPALCGGSGQDDNGHGTHVAGIAAAVTGNGKGIAGVAPASELVVAKVLDSAGRGSVADVSAGIRWVVDHGARVVNLSLGEPTAIVRSLLGRTIDVHDALDYAWSRGAVPVLAAGNTNALGFGLEGIGYGDLNAMVVGATAPDDRVASYSTSTGQAKWAILAPGGAGNGVDSEDVLSTFWVKGKANSYASLAGTSMAAPHVSGALALLLAHGYSPLGAVDQLLDTADSRVSCGANSRTCRGRLDVVKAFSGQARTSGQDQ